MIGVVGLSHKSAPVNIREKFAFNKEEYTDLSKIILKNLHFDELVIISTCNRTEFYFSAQEKYYTGAFGSVFNYLKTKVQEDSIESYFYQFKTIDAVNHLFRVISGLESMIIGEYQIVAQVKDAINHAEDIGSAGKILKRLFYKALETGKQVRTRTGLSNGAFSVSYAAVEKCSSIFEQLTDKKILLIGAGETGELAIKNLYKKACRNIVVSNRTISKAEELAKRYEGTVLDFRKLKEGINNADIIVSSVSSKEPIIDLGMFSLFSTSKQTVLIDLGVPRNIDQKLNEFDFITLYNVDDLQEVVNQNMEKKKIYINEAESIIDEKQNEFSNWLSTKKLSPVIQTMISEVNEINHTELEVFRKFHSKGEYETIEKYGKHITEKIVNSLIKNLKAISDNGRKAECVKIINDLFSFSNE